MSEDGKSYTINSFRSQEINSYRSRLGLSAARPLPPPRTSFASVSHHQHRAFGIAHHVAGIGAEEIGAHGMPLLAVRTHDDEVGLDGVRFLEDLLVDAALAHDRRCPGRGQRG